MKASKDECIPTRSPSAIHCQRILSVRVRWYGTARRWEVSSLLRHSINPGRLLRDQASESGALLVLSERCVVGSLKSLGRPRQIDSCPKQQQMRFR